MNSTIYLSKNYMKVLLRNNKGILILLTSILVILNLAVCFLFDSNVGTPYSVEIAGTIGVLGVFIVPFVLSAAILGFIYKSERIDLIGAMPMSKKRLYLTSIAFGLLYLIAMLGINFIIMSIYSVANPASGLAIKMLFDINVALFIAYATLFSMCVLAASVSGNIFTQIVVILLILFLGIFTRGIFSGMNAATDYKVLAIGNQTTTMTRSFEEFQLGFITYPLYIFVGVWGNQYTPLLNIQNVIYSIVISCIYFAAGFYLFTKRKFENTGSSFKKDKIHFIVKALTIYPMVFGMYILTTYQRIEENETVSTVVVFCFALILAYYFIYDFITRKKVKFKHNVLAFVGSFVGWYLIFTALFTNRIEMAEHKYDEEENFNYRKYVYVDDIDTLEFSYEDASDYTSAKESVFPEKIKITNHEDIKKILNSAVEYNDRYDDTRYLDMVVTIDGKKYDYYDSVPKKVISEVTGGYDFLNRAVEDNKIRKGDYFYINGYSTEKNWNDRYIKVPDELRIILNDNLADILKSNANQNRYDSNYYIRRMELNISSYRDFQHVNYSIDLTDFPEIATYAINMTNKEILKARNIDSVNSITKIDNVKREFKEYSTYSGYSRNEAYINSNLSSNPEFLQDLKKLAYDEFDATKPYYKFRVYDSDESTYYTVCTNNTSFIENEYIKKYNLELLNRDYYDKYYYDQPRVFDEYVSDSIDAVEVQNGEQGNTVTNEVSNTVTNEVSNTVTNEIANTVTNNNNEVMNEVVTNNTNSTI